MTDNSDPLDPADDKPVDNQEMEEFFHRLPSNFRWPKPNPEAVAAAVEAIQRMSGGAQVAEDLAASSSESSQPVAEGTDVCTGCQGALPMGARFCVWCGLPRGGEGTTTASRLNGVSAQHHVHHHYHHTVSGHAAPVQLLPEAENSAPKGRAPGTPGPAPGGRAELTARQVVQDWAQACNTRHIDDLVELYAADATLIRSSIPPVRSLPAIREFLLSMLEAGLGDVEMESLKLEVMGEIAMDMGRCKMLVPVAMGKRREERGKYLVILVRQAAGTWKILADCWASDLSVTAGPVAESVVRKGNEPQPPRKPR